MNRRSLILTGIVVLLAMGVAGQSTTPQWPAVDGDSSYALYALPSASSTPQTAPTQGVAIPAWANRAVMECRGGVVAWGYNFNPTATLGLQCQPGEKVIFDFWTMPLFRSIRWTGLDANAVVYVQYSRTSKDNS